MIIYFSNLVRSDSIVSIFLESVLLVNCHSYFSNQYHPKLAVYVCRFPCTQSPNVVVILSLLFITFSYVLHEDSFISSIIISFTCLPQAGDSRSFLRIWAWMFPFIWICSPIDPEKKYRRSHRSSLLLDNVSDVVLGRWLQGQLPISRKVSQDWKNHLRLFILWHFCILTRFLK